jgi:hypothetical protein
MQDGGMQASMELEHAIGFAGHIRKCLLFHPNGRDIGEKFLAQSKNDKFK